jgi:hypothetical protein
MDVLNIYGNLLLNVAGFNVKHQCGYQPTTSTLLSLLAAYGLHIKLKDTFHSNFFIS